MKNETQFHIRQNDTAFCVWAGDYNEAAQKAVRKFYPRVRGLRALQVTGEHGKSGLWNGYVPVKTGGLSAHGDNFHVM